MRGGSKAVGEQVSQTKAQGQGPRVFLLNVEHRQSITARHGVKIEIER